MILTIAFLVALAALAYDIYNTNKGLRAGIAQEGNEVITGLWKTKFPTWGQIAAIEVPIRATIFGVGCIPGPEQYPETFAVLATASLFVAAVKSVQGAREWQWMFKHPGQTIPERNTVWQKIMGFWG